MADIEVPNLYVHCSDCEQTVGFHAATMADMEWIASKAIEEHVSRCPRRN
jgi:hypothetical protein